MKVTLKDVKTILNKRWRMENLYKIRNENKKLVYLKFNEVQEELWGYCESKKHQGLELIQDKARKEGVTTFWAIYYLDETLFTPYTTSMIMAHVRQDVQKIFKIVKLAYNSCPGSVRFSSGKVWIKPAANYDNVNELTFGSIGSTIYVGLENRGDTINNLHISEAAHIKDPNRIAATLAAVPRNGKSNKTIESTANGIGDWFEETFHECQSGSGAYKAFFFGWWKKEANFVRPLPGYIPSEAARKKAELVKANYGIELKLGQLNWWDITKKEQKRLMDQEHPTVSEDSFLTSVNMAFDSEAMAKIIPRPPIRRMPIKIKSFNGKIKIYYLDIYVEPKPGRSYVLAGDPAEGVGSDSSGLEIVDDLTLEQVAEFESNAISPADFSQLVEKSARYYNNAIAAIERNNHGHLVLDRLKDIYHKIFFKVTFDEKNNKKTKKIGWETNSITRDLILDELEDLVENLQLKIYSAKLKSEMLTFVVDDTGKRQAKSGKHDDLIMAIAIALKVARMPRASFEVNRVN